MVDLKVPYSSLENLVSCYLRLILLIKLNTLGVIVGGDWDLLLDLGSLLGGVGVGFGAGRVLQVAEKTGALDGIPKDSPTSGVVTSSWVG